jgi:capsular polysaccharide biosynthesis protein
MTSFRPAITLPRAIAGAVLIAALGTVAGGVLLAPKTYEAEATIAVVKSPTSPGEVSSLDEARRRLAKAATSPTVLAQASERLDPGRTPESLAAQVSGEAPGDLPVVVVSARDPDRHAAAAIAQAVAVVLVEERSRHGAERVSIVSPATVPRMFSQPSIGPLLAVGLAASLLLAALTVQVWTRGREGLGSVMEIENAAAAPMLGHLLAPADLTLLPALTRGTETSARFAVLARRLLAAGGADTGAALVVVGAHEVGSGLIEEQHVWVATNLAAAMAMDGRRTLLVDGRIGDPSEPGAGPAPDAAGLADVLAGVGVAQAVIAGPIDGLWVLPAGTSDRPYPRVESPGGAAGGLRIADTVSMIAQDFDSVILLAPDQGRDASGLVASQRVLLVVPDVGVAPAHVQALTSRIRRAGGRIQGVVVVEQDA